MFNENSALVKLWVRSIKSGHYTREHVPDLYNLKEVVFAILDAEE